MRNIGAWGALALASCVVFLLGLWTLDRAEREDAVTRATHLAEATSAVALARAEGVVGEVEQAFQAIADLVAAEGGLAAIDPTLLQIFVDTRADALALADSVIVVDADGRVVVHSDDPDAVGINVSSRDYFRIMADGRRSLYIGPPLVTRTTGQRVIPLVQALVTRNGAFAGLVAAGLSPDDLLRQLPPPLDADGSVALLSGDGIVLVRHPDNEAYIGRDVGGQPLFREHLPVAAKGSYEAVSPLDGRRRIAAYTAGLDGAIVAVASVSHAAVTGARAESRARLLFVGLLGTVTVLVLFLLLARTAARRRRAIEELVESREDLALLNADLEHRVEERTRALSRSEARSRAFLHTAHDAVVVFDPDGFIVEFNPAASRVLGYAREEAAALGFTDLVVDYHADRPEDAVCRRKGGATFPAEVWVGREEGEASAGHTVYIIRDITRRKRAEAQLIALATTDPLTGALNRRALSEAAQNALALARRHERPLSVLMIDADHFKAVNDTYGHDAGDAVLKDLVALITGSLRTTDILGRIGGEEFVAVLPETDSDGAAILAGRILDAARSRAVRHGGTDLHVTVSIGVATCDAATCDIDVLMKRADEAVYAAKRQGRDRMVVAAAECQTA